MKPLNSPLIATVRPHTPPPLPLDPLGIAVEVIETPKGGKDVLTLMRQYSFDESPSRRLVARKVAKALEVHIAEVVIQKHKVQALEEELERAHKKRHQRVKLQPNTKFATIEDVMRTKKEEVKQPQKRIVKAGEDEEDEGTDDEGGSEVEEVEAEDLATRRSTRARKPTRFFDD